MAGKHEKPKSEKKRRKWPWILLILLLLLIGAFLFMHFRYESSGTPTLIVETPQKLSLAQNNEFTLDVTISSLGDARYPAMSMSLSFDNSRLEFIGLEEGNVFILSNESASGQQLPTWSYSAANANQTGLINIMYLDMTGGKNAFCSDLLAEEDNVVLRLKFRLRGSIRAGDVLDLILEDAVFAASNEQESLAMTTGSLKTKNGKLVIGE